jgi:hypothetical protein
VLKVGRSIRLEDVAGELLHPWQISFCIGRELHRRQPLSRSTDRLSEAVYAIGVKRSLTTVVIVQPSSCVAVTINELLRPLRLEDASRSAFAAVRPGLKSPRWLPDPLVYHFWR